MWETTPRGRFQATSLPSLISLVNPGLRPVHAYVYVDTRPSIASLSLSALAAERTPGASGKDVAMQQRGQALSVSAQCRSSKVALQGSDAALQ